MNSLLCEKLDKLHQRILMEPCIKEYLYYKNLISNHLDLLELEEDVRFLQKQWLCEHDEDIARLYKEKKELLDSNPLMKNYLLAKEEAYLYLEHISLYITSRL